MELYEVDTKINSRNILCLNFHQMSLIGMQPKFRRPCIAYSSFAYIRDTLEIKTKSSSEEGILLFSFLIYMFLFSPWVWVNSRQYKNLWTPSTLEWLHLNLRRRSGSSWNWQVWRLRKSLWLESENLKLCWEWRTFVRFQPPSCRGMRVLSSDWIYVATFPLPFIFFFVRDPCSFFPTQKAVTC